MKRRFRTYIVLSAELVIDEAVFDQVDDSFRENLYNLKNDQEVAEHLAYNFVVNNARLTQLDGWANLDDRMVQVMGRGVDEVEVIELEPV